MSLVIEWTPWWLAALLGLALGSFNNVLIHRLPRGDSLLAPPSSCPSCARRIRPWENIPLLSWLLLKGRCAGCGWRIPARYPLVELLTMLVALSVAWRVPMDWSWIVWIPVGSLLVALAGIDLATQRLPNQLTATLAILGLLGQGLVLLGFVQTDTACLPGPLDALLGALAGGGSLWLFAWIGWLLFKRESMGAGDIKLMAALGLVLGWQGVLLAIFLASLGGAVGGLLFRRSRFQELPFGPWLALGGWASFLWGAEIIRLYLAYALAGL